MLYTDHFGWPITACPYASTSNVEFIEVSEVISQMVRRACLFRPAEDQRATTVSTTTTTITTANLSLANRRIKSVEGEKDDVSKEPVVQAAASYSYSDFVSLISNFLKDHKITQLFTLAKRKD